MTTGFVVTLALAVIVLLAARLVLSALPLRRLARPAGRFDAAMSAVGMLGLVLHCVAMFNRGLVDWVPGSAGPIGQIRALGTFSEVWYVVAAALLVLGLRRQQPPALGAVVVALVAVGVTMYNGGGLQPHLVAIFAFVTILAAVITMLVLPPGRPTPLATAATAT